MWKKKGKNITYKKLLKMITSGSSLYLPIYIPQVCGYILWKQYIWSHFLFKFYLICPKQVKNCIWLFWLDWNNHFNEFCLKSAENLNYLLTKIQASFALNYYRSASHIKYVTWNTCSENVKSCTFAFSINQIKTLTFS